MPLQIEWDKPQIYSIAEDKFRSADQGDTDLLMAMTAAWGRIVTVAKEEQEKLSALAKANEEKRDLA